MASSILHAFHNTTIMANKKRVIIQGGFGAFHEIAALHYFENEDIEIVPALTFKEIFQKIMAGEVDYGIVAIENIVAGSIIPNYKLLQESSTKIIGEIYLRIKQNLVALPGQNLSDITEVYSHPMAILQCQDFFDAYPHLKSIESVDTALSAKDIMEKGLKGVAAIASEQAAKMYNLELMREGIESNKENYTRFLILIDRKNEKATNKTANKASLTFSVGHRIGSLSKVLTIFSFFNINLSKIQSLPIIGKDWEYLFYADVEFDDYEIYEQSLQTAKAFCGELRILGEYNKGKSIV